MIILSFIIIARSIKVAPLEAQGRHQVPQYRAEVNKAVTNNIINIKLVECNVLGSIRNLYDQIPVPRFALMCASISPDSFLRVYIPEDNLAFIKRKYSLPLCITVPLSVT